MRKKSGIYSLTDTVKKDCEFYIENKKTCNALNNLYCAKEKCSFYKKKVEKVG